MKWILLWAVLLGLGYILIYKRREMNQALDRAALFLLLLMILGTSLRISQWAFTP